MLYYNLYTKVEIQLCFEKCALVFCILTSKLLQVICLGYIRLESAKCKTKMASMSKLTEIAFIFSD